MAEQSVDATKAPCTACGELPVYPEGVIALAAATEGLCVACYELREAAMRVAASRGFRLGL